MRQTTQYMLLWLEGPLQSWGGDSKFGVRDTLNFPTRSGILGLICCARGAAGP
ncbi:TPA: type I-E CRISPR-associated protein Cas5/CasD, partial [Klebsiella pneumoniae]|nr:type I-E CRISPR-associated protein Cas5/CasD [Klebsiella pneumoniae]